jgi:phage terminase small subunit
MARQRSPNRDKAFEIYKKHNGEKDLIKIAEELYLSPGTVRGWKNKDKWDEKLFGTLQKNTERSNDKKIDKKLKKEPVISDKDEVLKNAELTEKQRLFCLYYIKCFNATQSAIKAGYASESAHAEGSRLLRNVKVKSYIRELKGKMTDSLFIDAMDVLNKYIQIAFADITDYLTFGQREVPIMGPFGPIENEDGEVLTKLANFVDFEESNLVDGTIISEVKQGKDGVSIKFEDRMKALDRLSQYFDLFPDNFKRKIEEEKIRQSREKLELEKTKVTGTDTETADDGFIEALEGRVDEVWEDEE